MPEPTDYRAAPYQAPTPATLAGALVVDTAEARRLHDRGVPFIDVYPRHQRPPNLPAGTIFREAPHTTIPGALWLYDTGYERLDPAAEARLRAGLRAASHGDPGAPLVIFCRRACWLSWDAARRAVAWGYTGVRWYPDGVEGGAEAGGPLQPAQP